jgi:hypothetical protein
MNFYRSNCWAVNYMTVDNVCLWQDVSGDLQQMLATWNATAVTSFKCMYSYLCTKTIFVWRFPFIHPRNKRRRNWKVCQNFLSCNLHFLKAKLCHLISDTFKAFSSFQFILFTYNMFLMTFQILWKWLIPLYSYYVNILECLRYKPVWYARCFATWFYFHLQAAFFVITVIDVFLFKFSIIGIKSSTLNRGLVRKTLDH